MKYYSISPAACHGGAGSAGSASFVFSCFFHDSVLACFLFVVGGVNLPPKNTTRLSHCLVYVGSNSRLLKKKIC